MSATNQLLEIAFYIENKYASRYGHWTRKERDRELGRAMDYIMDLDAGDIQIPAEIQSLMDNSGRKLTEEEEDIIIAWSESNTPGYY